MGGIDVEVGLRIKDVPPSEVEALLMVFVHVARKSGGVINLDRETQKVIEGMPKVKGALKAAPIDLGEFGNTKQDLAQAIAESGQARRAEQKRATSERKAEAIATRRMERRDARDARQAEKENRRANKGRGERDEVRAALADAHFRVADAARKLGLTPSGLYQKMHRLGLRTKGS